MMLLHMAARSLLSRRSSALLTLFTLALSTALLLGIEHIRTQSKAGFFNTVQGTDLIVGARSGPVQLLLYSVFHIGSATSNIRWNSYAQLHDDPRVAWTIPLSLGDSHRGYRVIGTSNSMFEHYRYGEGNSLQLAAGEPLNGLFSVVLGAEVARALNYQLNDSLVIAHGTGNTSFMQHDNMPFHVSGILKPTGTPLDRALLVTLEGLEAVHLGWRAGIPLPGAQATPEQARQRDLTPRQLTAALVGLNSRMQAFHLQRELNSKQTDPLTAVMPGVALQELWQVVRLAEKALLAVSAAALLIGLCGMLAVLLGGMQQRRHEIAVLRALGASPMRISALLLLETLLLAVLGLLLGLALLWGGMYLLQQPLLEQFGLHISLTWPSAQQMWLAAIIIGLGVCSGLIPALLAYRMALVNSLGQRH